MTKELGREGILFANNFDFSLIIERIECDVIDFFGPISDILLRNLISKLKDENTTFLYTRKQRSVFIDSILIKDKNNKEWNCKVNISIRQFPTIYRLNGVFLFNYSPNHQRSINYGEFRIYNYEDKIDTFIDINHHFDDTEYFKVSYDKKTKTKCIIDRNAIQE